MTSPWRPSTVLYYDMILSSAVAFTLTAINSVVCIRWYCLLSLVSPWRPSAVLYYVMILSSAVSFTLTPNYNVVLRQMISSSGVVFTLTPIYNVVLWDDIVCCGLLMTQIQTKGPLIVFIITHPSRICKRCSWSCSAKTNSIKGTCPG